MHACCGPCSLGCIQSARGDGHIPALFFDNPNIHPYTEYEARKASLLEAGARTDTQVILHGGYGLRAFLGAVGVDGDGRCSVCYQIRLDETARYAKAHGFAGFTTTLLISPYQNHECLRRMGEAAALKAEIPFWYKDFRPLFQESRKEARRMGLYMQKYCGCIFSEEERYLTRG
jgi:predicted adenine nucleotide alpha hydrolase (AANH) superfamily ATPase